MLVDKSARVWSMRPDDVVAAHAVQVREARAEGGAPSLLAGAELLEGSDFAQVLDGVAVIPVKGALMRSQSFFFWSYEEIQRDVALAQASADVRAIVLDIDSPGGLASGCGDCAAAIRASGSKPVHAFVGGLAASAAYWIAAAAGSITVGSGSVLGSLGAVMEYVDVEPMFEKMGARVVRVVAEQTPNKRLDPHSDEGRAEMQAIVDALAADFLADVAAHRGVAAEEVAQRFGAGMIFAEGEAIRRGMADSRGTLEGLIAGLAARDLNDSAVSAAAAKETPMDWASLTLAELREHRSDIAEAITAEADQAAAADRDTAVAEAATKERERILALEEVAVDGHEDLVRAAKEDGKTTAAELALKIVKAEKAAGATWLKDRKSEDDGIEIDAKAPSGGGGGDPAKAAWDKDANLRAEFGDDFDAYAAYAKNAAAGRARVLSR